MGRLSLAVRRLVADDGALAAVEHALLAAGLGVAIAAGAALLGADLKVAFEAIGAVLDPSRKADPGPPDHGPHTPGNSS